MGKKTDLRVRKTRHAIHTAFREMICTLEPKDITVQSLAARAQINRKTFYLHYHSIEALFEEMIQQVTDAYFEMMRTLPTPVDMDQQTQVTLEFYCSQPEHVEKMICHPSYRHLSDQITARALQRNRERYNGSAHLAEEIQKIVNVFLVSATMDIYRHWVQEGKTLPVNDLIKTAVHLISYGYKGYVHKE